MQTLPWGFPQIDACTRHLIVYLNKKFSIPGNIEIVPSSLLFYFILMIWKLWMHVFSAKKIPCIFYSFSLKYKNFSYYFLIIFFCFLFIISWLYSFVLLQVNVFTEGWMLGTDECVMFPFKMSSSYSIILSFMKILM